MLPHSLRLDRIASWKLTPRGVCFQLACYHIGSVLCQTHIKTFSSAPPAPPSSVAGVARLQEFPKFAVLTAAVDEATNEVPEQRFGKQC